MERILLAGAIYLLAVQPSFAQSAVPDLSDVLLVILGIALFLIGVALAYFLHFREEHRKYQNAHNIKSIKDYGSGSAYAVSSMRNAVRQFIKNALITAFLLVPTLGGVILFIYGLTRL